ncbi:L-rhamnose mutarotase [Lewinella marina]|uniref:L-fucose mutarotase n=1 Tax=Neolewinella marina TaxID=438751 RepID=A0A2G0CJ99_9BACT|nr:L-rhamnose mutarotase [Neolewinella marina]NJB84793.1 L-rhamnose mutarotase [Neolewinella marina]PHL00049.1 L-fucose mutarotase [Neolewinella marina]
MPLHYFLCDLKDDAAAIAAYEDHHAPGNVWPEVVESIRGAGIRNMEILRAGNRLVMVMETGLEYDAQAKAAADAANPVVQRWERLMDTFQQRLPFAAADQKWVPLHRIFNLHDQL